MRPEELKRILASGDYSLIPDSLRLAFRNPEVRAAAEAIVGPIPAAVYEDAPEPPLPSFGRRASNLAGAVVDVATHAVATGEIYAPQSVQDARWRVCESGEGLPPDEIAGAHCDRFRPSDGACSECGCNLRYKVTLAAMACPLGRWKE